MTFRDLHLRGGGRRVRVDARFDQPDDFSVASDVILTVAHARESGGCERSSLRRDRIARRKCWFGRHADQRNSPGPRDENSEVPSGDQTGWLPTPISVLRQPASIVIGELEPLSTQLGVEGSDFLPSDTPRLGAPGDPTSQSGRRVLSGERTRRTRPESISGPQVPTMSLDPVMGHYGTASLTIGVRSIVGAKGTVMPVSTDSQTFDAESTKRRTPCEPASPWEWALSSAASQAEALAQRKALGPARRPAWA